jgi:hypothetical protein
MKDSLDLIFSSPVANLMIVAGLICLGLAVLGKIEIKEFKLGPSTRSERFFATVIGVALLIVGFRLLPASVEAGSIDSPARPSPESSVSSTDLSTPSLNSAPPTQSPNPSISTSPRVQSPNPSTTAVQTRFSPQASEPKQETRLIPLYNWWSPSREDNFATTNTEFNGGPDYQQFRVEGYVFDPALPRRSGTIPLYLWWSSSREDNFTTTYASFDGYPDYRRARIEGYIFDPSLPQPPRTVALRSYWSPSREDNFATIDSNFDGGPDYDNFRLEGYVRVSP